VPEDAKQHLQGAAVAIWTTTGWTIPANQAVAVNDRLQYAVVEAQACSCRPSTYAYVLTHQINEMLDLVLAIPPCSRYPRRLRLLFCGDWLTSDKAQSIPC